MLKGVEDLADAVKVTMGPKVLSIFLCFMNAEFSWCSSMLIFIVFFPQSKNNG